MKNKTILITGATAGIGKTTAISLAKMGATVVFNSRNPERGEQAKSDIIKQSGNDRITVLPCDLASMDSIHRFAEAVQQKFTRIDVLINNAGVWEQKRKLSQDGFENTLSVNHLAPFLLTGLLIDTLANSSPARIINVSSGLHTQGVVHFDDLQSERSFSSLKVYSNTKLMNILFTRVLAAKYKNKGITANALHPGFIATQLGRNSNILMQLMIRLTAGSKQKGAATPVFLASSPIVEEITGEYFVNKKIAPSSEASKDMEVAYKLWAISEQMCNISF